MSNFLVNSYIEFPSVFSPDDISDLTIWYDFSEVDTITKDGSNRVSAVNDKSDSDYDLVQATSGSQPLWVSADKNSLDVIDFDSSRFMSSTFSEIDQPTTMVFACEIPTGNNLSITGNTSGSSSQNLKTNVTNKIAVESSGSVVSDLITGLNGSWRVVIVVGNGSSSKIYIGGVDKGTGTMSGGIVNWLLAAEDTTGGYSDSKMGEVIMYSKALDATEIGQLQTYLSEKWDI